MLPKFLPFEGKYVTVGAVWRHNAPQEATRATVFSSPNPYTLATLGAVTGTRQIARGDLHNLIRDPDACPELYTTMIELRTPPTV